MWFSFAAIPLSLFVLGFVIPVSFDTTCVEETSPARPSSPRRPSIRPRKMDDCVSEDKNNFLIGYTYILVREGVAEVIEVRFMMVGNTHIQVDQVVSR